MIQVLVLSCQAGLRVSGLLLLPSCYVKQTKRYRVKSGKSPSL